MDHPWKIFTKESPLYIHLFERGNFINKEFENLKKQYQRDDLFDKEWNDKIGPYNLLRPDAKFIITHLEPFISTMEETLWSIMPDDVIENDVNYVNRLLIEKKVDYSFLIEYDKMIDKIFYKIINAKDTIKKYLSQNFSRSFINHIEHYSSNYQNFDFNVIKNKKFKLTTDRANIEELICGLLLIQFTINNEVVVSNFIDYIPSKISLTHVQYFKDKKSYFKNTYKKNIIRYSNMGLIKFIDSKRKIRLTLFGKIIRQLNVGNLTEFNFETLDLSKKSFLKVERYIRANSKHPFLDPKAVFEYLKIFINMANEMQHCTNSDFKTLHKYASKKTSINLLI